MITTPAQPVGPAFSPLDDALGLSGSRYSAQILGWLARLGAEVPFARAAFWLEELTGVVVSAATVRRQSEALGATAVAQTEAEVMRLARQASEPLAHPERLVLGADGAMVPLVGGEWAEVKLLSVGVPERRGQQVRSTALSYFARLADAETFGTQALGELHRVGLDGARAVAAVQDGAPWLQGFVDYHRPDALRILDWPHAAEHLTHVAEAVLGAGTPRAKRAASRLRAWLWQEGPDRLLAVLNGWLCACPDRPELASAVSYFRERRAQLAYPAFRAAGWPVGSGATESGHKQVMQARMKRAGMRWARPHVNPLLALALLEHNHRWASDGPLLLAQHRCSCLAQRRSRHQARRRDRLAHRRPATCPAVHPATPVAPQPPVPAPRLPPAPHEHPWRRYGAWLSAKI